MLSITHVASMATRSIMILYLVFKTSKVKADLVNVALGKSTSQFEIEPSTTEIWPSSNAVDGEKECTTVTKKFYTLTAESHDPWWMVNLGDQFRIQEIIVHGRHDNITNQLHGFRLYLSLNNSFDENNIVYTNRDYNNGTIYITQNLTGVFQYVRLDLPNTFRGETAGKDGKQPGPLVLCEVEVLVNITNIALGKTASMSTVYGSMTADKSVDGSQRRDAITCNCCSHSQDETNPWLKINLLHSYKIYRITVIGRSDDNRDNRMIGGLEIYTYNSQNLAVGNNTIANNSVVTVSFPSGSIASNVVLKRPRKQGNSEWYLVVCKVKIYTTVSVCLAGTYRDYIENQCKSCGHCKTQPCNKDTGTCPGGVCMAGWTGAVCNTACDDGFYGQNCSLNCSGHCKGGVHQCNKTNGKCMQGCVDGYTGERCETECQDGYFGDCTHRCHCKDDLPCLKTDGVCTENCTFGWGGKNCSIDLSLIRQLTHVVTNQTGMYETYDSSKAIDGKDRYDVNTCNCCSVTNGIVPSWWQIDLGDKYLIDAVKIYGRSDIGSNNYQLENATVYASNQTMVNNNVSQTLIYRIPTITKSTVFTHHLKTSTIAQFFIVKSVKKILTICEFNLFRKVCDVGKFGTGCSHTCHCSDNKSCDSITGKCKEPGCFPGWKGESCNLKCESHSFGKNCSQKCQCINETNCDNVNGQCDERECAPGWIECHSRSFGKNCNHTCHCVNGTNCDHVNGQCDKHECDPGWTGASCETECESKSFGKNCSQTCHCINGTHCDNVKGYCDKQECDPGWTGESCQTERQSSKENSKSSSAAIGGGIGAAVAFVIIAVIIGFIIYRRRNVKDSSDKTNKFTNLDKALDSRRQRLSERHVPSMNERVNRSFEGEEETAMIQSGSGDYYSFGDNFGVRTFELWDYIRKKMENKCEKLYSEFQTLPNGLMYPCKSAENLVNKGKHRYKEMYAYDHSRVVLEVEEGTHTDYINACYIDGYDKTKKFVASQGPTKQMINDFWRMVWQLKSDKIVMLTDLIEMGTVKCLQYWPLEDEEEEHCFGKVIVKVLNTESFLDYNIRLFEVRKNGESARRIRQFHFKSWPDKDVPDSTWCLVSFWRAVNTNEPSTAGPIVVHCSAGVGRTGTFIALDNLVSQAKAEGCVRPLQIVEALRRQRVNMVQTREQYVYLHEAVADALLFGTHYIFTKQFGDMFLFMLRKEKGETKSNLEKQFELIEKSTRDTTSDAAENVEYTNVETIQSESEAYRPKLKKRGSRFVQELGAMYIPNYKGKNTFLISMSPDKNTMEEFWSLVDYSHIKTIIVLTETSAPCYQASSQLGANLKNGSKFSVNKIEEKIRKGFTERSFCFKESDREEEEYLTTVKQFEYTDWKDGSAVPGETKQMLDMINSIQKWQSHLSESQPILIHCSDGFKRSGIICVLLNELQRIQYEGGLVNILESVKMMKKRQKFLIPTYEEYRFCFDLILAHSKTTEVYANI